MENGFAGDWNYSVQNHCITTGSGFKTFNQVQDQGGEIGPQERF
jgi:hypothetical protein